MANVIIRNKTPQLLRVSTVDEHGRPQELALQPFAQSAPLDESLVGTLTRRFVDNGYVAISRAP